jgi:selenocysteine-specific elongation factor
MKRLLLGIIGHVDHGKTALVRALTGMETDRLPEEKRRGISIALGFAHFRLGADEIDIIDMPGHERFVRTMVSGATGISAVLLVVAANEGVMPQTVEHLDIAALLGLRRAVIVISKADLVSPGEGRRVAQEVASFVAGAGMEAPVPILASAVTGAGLDAIRTAVAGILADAASPADAGFAYLPVDRAFTVAGHGTVVTGTLRHGSLTADSEIELVPDGTRVRVRSLQVHGAAVTAAAPGQRVAINLRGVDVAGVPRGTALCTPGLLPACDWLSVELSTVRSAPVLRTTTRLQLLFGTEEVEARLRLLDRDEIRPGETALAQLHCARPVSAPARERFILRIASPALTVAGGRILDPATRRLRRNAPRTLERLTGLAAAEGIAAILARELEASGGAGCTLSHLARIAGTAPAQVRAALSSLSVVRLRGDRLVGQAAFDRVLAGLPRVLAGQVQDVSRERLVALVPGASPPVLEEAVTRLAAAGLLRQEGGTVRLARPAQERERARRESELAARLAEAIRRGGLSPPDVAADSDVQVRRMLERLVREGIIVRTHDRVQKRDVLFHREAIETARRRLVPLLAGEMGILVKEAGAALGISRKFSVPLLEYLDSIHFTRRVGDRRVLGDTGQS